MGLKFIVTEFESARLDFPYLLVVIATLIIIEKNKRKHLSLRSFWCHELKNGLSCTVSKSVIHRNIDLNKASLVNRFLYSN